MSSNKDVKRWGYCGILSNILILSAITVAIILGIYFSLWNGTPSESCKDFNPCTLDKRLPDSTCVNRPFENGTSCSHDDVCYNSTAYPICINGLCTGQLEFCKGYCNVDADCPILPWSYRLNDNPLGSCTAHSCVYTFVSITSDCLSWLDNPPDNPLVLQGCLYDRFTTEFGPPVCLIRYGCALFDFATPRIGNNDVSINTEDLYNTTMTAINFFTNSNITFNDLPINPLNLITLYSQIYGLLNNTATTFKDSLAPSSNQNDNSVASKIKQKEVHHKQKTKHEYI
jgi:hypothetical protein